MDRVCAGRLKGAANQCVPICLLVGAGVHRARCRKNVKSDKQATLPSGSASPHVCFLETGIGCSLPLSGLRVQSTEHTLGARADLWSAVYKLLMHRFVPWRVPWRNQKPILWSTTMWTGKNTFLLLKKRFLGVRFFSTPVSSHCARLDGEGLDRRTKSDNHTRARTWQPHIQ